MILLVLLGAAPRAARAGHCERSNASLETVKLAVAHAYAARAKRQCPGEDDDEDDKCSPLYTAASYKRVLDAKTLNAHLSVPEDLVKVHCAECCEEYLQAVMHNDEGSIFFRDLSLLSDGPPPSKAGDSLDHLWL
eukprot:2672584-Prymnesium_polylepis.1